MRWRVRIHPEVVKFIDKHLSPEDKVRILDLFDRLAKYGLQLGWPYTRQIEGKLWELRPQGTRGTYRFLYFTASGRQFLIVMAMRKRARISTEVKRTAQRRLDYFEEGG